MALFSHKEFSQHEQIVFGHDETTGLKAIIAIHSTKLGPALGGCRMWHYSNEGDALTDVLRLARGMTYKAAISNIPFGGGKSVIIGNAKTDKTPELLRAMGRLVESLGGKYITAEDVGMSEEDMDHIAETTSFVTGLKHESGDPSPATAFGVYQGIKASSKFLWGDDSLKDKRISVQGVGHVGSYLCDHLHQEGAKLFITDIDQKQLEHIANKTNATIVAPDEIYNLNVDIYAPCALGATLSDLTIPQLKAKIVAGSANNQLHQEHHAQMLKECGILYAPDYVINAGGIINIAHGKDYNKARAFKQVGEIYNSLLNIYAVAQKNNISPSTAADQIVEEKLAQLG